MQDYLPKLQNLLQEIERLGNLRTELLKKKVINEAALNDKEDFVRGEALESSMPVSRIPLYIKHHTQNERKNLHEAESNYKSCHQTYEVTVEILQAIKFEVRMIEMLGG